jgi:hypothetical protein
MEDLGGRELPEPFDLFLSWRSIFFGCADHRKITRARPDR